MGKSSSQVVGYRYYAKFAAFIGNRIEKFLGINFDNRGWINKGKDDTSDFLAINKQNLYGEAEGGIAGVIDIHLGTPDQEPNLEYQKYFPLVSGYPYQSYLVFRGEEGPDFSGVGGIYEEVANILGASGRSSFYVGNSGYMKEMLLWVKRTRVRNDGSGQWYEVRGDGAVVCEIGTKSMSSSDIEGKDFNFSFKVKNTDTFTRPGRENEIIDEREVNVVYKYNPATDSFIPSNYSTADYYIRSPSYGHGLYYYYEREINIQLAGMGLVDLILNVKMKSLDRPEIEITGGFISSIDDQTIESTDERGSISRNGTYRATVLAQGNVTVKLTVNRALDGFEEHILISTFQLLKKSFSKIYLDLDENPDINPIHKIREILTDDTAMGKPGSDVNDMNFMKAADRIYDEGLGISWAINEKSCIEAIEELCYHVEAGIRVNRQTGLYEMVLFRDDWFDEEEIHTIAENKIKDLSLEVMNSDDIVNQLNVTYYDRERIKNSTFSVYENGSILTIGHANAESVEFPYFMNMRNAEIVANWKLKQFSTPAWSGSFATGWKEARKWNRYDLIRLPWSKKWNGTILVRIMKINLGNCADNAVMIDFEEVIPYSGEMNTSIVVDAPVESAPQTPQPSVNAVFEVPYYLTVLRAGQTNADLELSNNPDIGYVAAIAAKPQNNSLNALLYTDGGVGKFEQVSRLDYCDVLQLDQPITETTTSFTVTGILTQTANSNNLILLNDEWMGFISFDNETKVLTVKRGVLDTVPKKHSSGSLFVIDLPDVAFDSIQYAQGEIIEAQVLTTTPSGIQELSVSGAGVEIKSRAIRPYPPANVKINGTYYPETIIVANDIVLTWGDRNRLQQTGGEILGFFDGGVTVESDVTYSYELLSESVILSSASGITASSATIPASVLVPNKPHALKLWSVRDGYESYQIFEHFFFVEAVSLILSANTTSNNVSGNTLAEANIIVNVDTSLSANMRFDGSNIKGKAPAGSIITIEVEE
ncbi:phage tail protein [Acinetobacter sp. YH01021]|uniref:phage tail protein n=1 Tax=Acinetobacter sp. YH01021 TaxID=2601035 RepID=UPI0015D18A2B|nr:phage tail protein [Acinetobacter sp. YH01021]